MCDGALSKQRATTCNPADNDGNAHESSFGLWHCHQKFDSLCTGPTEGYASPAAGSWSALTGDSVSLHSTVGIDYHSTHLWVDDWQVAPALPDPYTDATGAPANPSDFGFHRFDLRLLSPSSPGGSLAIAATTLRCGAIWQEQPAQDSPVH